MTPDETTRIFKLLEKIEAFQKRMEGLLLGTYDKPEGVVAKVEKHETWITKYKRSREGFYNYAYKLVIMIALFYIASQIGLK